MSKPENKDLVLFTDLIETKYTAAASKAEADEFLTTEELTAPFVQHSGAVLPKDVVFAELRAQGYQYEWIGESVVWLLKKV